MFLFDMNVSVMRSPSRFSSQPLTIPAPWAFLRVGWSIPLFPPWVTATRFLAGNREAELKMSDALSLIRQTPRFRDLRVRSRLSPFAFTTFCCTSSEGIEEVSLEPILLLQNVFSLSLLLLMMTDSVG